MKKQLFSILAVAALVMGLTSCSKDDPATPMTVDTTKTATVNGIAHAKIDQTSSTTQYAPSGTKIFVKVAYSDLFGGTMAGDYVVVATVGANGVFSAQIPVTNSGVSAEVQGDDFTATATIPGVPTATSENQKFTIAATATPTLTVGATTYIVIDYGTGVAYK